MNDVRASINRLIERRYDKITPVGFDEQEARISFESSTKVIELIRNTIKPALDDSTENLVQTKMFLRRLIQEFKSSLSPFLVAINSKTSKRGADLNDQFEKLFRSMEHTPDHSCGDEEARGGVDSDEEDRLYEELDQMTEAYDRISAFSGPPEKFMANSFQKAFLNISNLVVGFELVLPLL